MNIGIHAVKTVSPAVAFVALELTRIDPAVAVPHIEVLTNDIAV